VATAESADQALTVLAKGRPGLALPALRMPVMNGWDFMKGGEEDKRLDD